MHLGLSPKWLRSSYVGGQEGKVCEGRKKKGQVRKMNWTMSLALTAFKLNDSELQELASLPMEASLGPGRRLWPELVEGAGELATHL